MGETTIRLCDGLTIAVAGERLEARLPGRQGRVVFAYLLANRGRSVTRHELMDALWPADPPPTAAATLKSLVSKLRRAIAPLEIAGRSELRLVLPPGAAIDVEDAEAALRQAETALAAARHAEAGAAARRALALCGAPPLLGLEGAWVDELRRGAEAVATRALEVVATAALAGGDATAAEGAARELVERDPFRESAHLLLVRALRARGDNAAAALVYEKLRRLLRDELGVAPSAEAQRLHAEVVAAGLAPAAATSGRLARELPDPLAELAAGPFAGRAAELAALDERIGARRRALVALTGEPGIGKTRLAAAAAARAHERGAAVLAGRCDGAAPYAALAEAIGGCLASADDADVAALVAEGGPELLLVVPALRRRARAVAEPPGRPDAELVREAVAAAVELVCAGRPGVLVVDDLHLADGGTAALLGHLLRRPGTPLTVLACVRSGEATPHAAELLEALAREGLRHDVPLAGLAEPEIAALAAELLGGDRGPAAASELAVWTGGNPLLLSETLRAARAGGGVDLEALAVPTTVRQLVRDRVARLPEATREAVAAAAVLGPDAPFDVLREALGWPAPRLAAALDEAIAADLLVPVAGDGGVRFAHELVRRALHDDVGALRRAELHLAAGRALEALRGPALEPHLERLARHFGAAASVGAAPEAFAYARRAGERAAAVLAFAEAATHLGRALELAPAAGARDDEVAHVELARAAALGRAGATPEARAGFLAAAERARRLGRSDLLARAALGYGAGRRFGFVEQAEERLLELLDESLALLPEDDTRLRPRVLALLASELYYVASPERRRELAGRALELARAGTSERTLAEVVQLAQWATIGPDDPGRRSAAADELEAIARRLRTAEWLFAAGHLRLVAALERGDRRGFEDAARRCRALAGNLRQPFYVWLAGTYEALTALLDGRLDDGDAASQRALAAWPAGAAGPGGVFAGMQLFLSFWARGRLDELREATRAFADAYAWIPAWRCALAFLEAETGHPEQARRLVTEMSAPGRVPRDGNWLLSSMLLGMATGATRVREHAFALRAALIPHRAQHGVAAGGVLTLGPVSLVVGVLDGVLGSHAAAVAHLEEAVAASAALADGPLLARARLELSLALERRGEPGDAERARDELTRARELAARVGMPADAHGLGGAGRAAIAS